MSLSALTARDDKRSTRSMSTTHPWPAATRSRNRSEASPPEVAAAGASERYPYFAVMVLSFFRVAQRLGLIMPSLVWNMKVLVDAVRSGVQIGVLVRGNGQPRQRPPWII